MVYMSEFKREIGQKFAVVFGPFPGFGRVTTCAINILERKEAVLVTLIKTESKKGVRVSLKVLRCSLVRLSGPGDFPRELIILFFYGSVRGPFKDCS